MNISSPHSIEDQIISNLQDGSLPIVKLIDLIKTKRPGTTKQGVYRTIRQLKRDEVVVVHQKNISLSAVWLSSMTEFLSKAQYSNTKSVTPAESFLNLQQGEKIRYYFKNPILTDAFWSHVFLSLMEISPPTSPILIYNPHEWFLLVREENEMSLFDRITDRGQKLAVLVGGKTPLDKHVRRHFDGTNKMYETLPEPVFPKTNYYINILADYIIEVWLDEKISQQIDAFYLKTQIFDKVAFERLDNILSQRGNNKFLITRNKRKADKLRMLFKRHFFLK
jgi:hypothetical protein